MSDEQFEFVMAIDEYKRANARPFPTWTEVLEVIWALGYRRVAEPQSLAYARLRQRRGRQTRSGLHATSAQAPVARVIIPPHSLQTRDPRSARVCKEQCGPTPRHRLLSVRSPRAPGALP